MSAFEAPPREGESPFERVMWAAYWAPIVALELGLTREWVSGEVQEMARALELGAHAYQRRATFQARAVAGELARFF